MNPYVDAPENITGLSGIINKKKTKKNLDLLSVEQEMLRNFKSTKEASDAVDDFKEEMRKITVKSGMDFGETWDPDDLMGSEEEKPKPTLPDIDDDDIFGPPTKDPLNNKFRKNIGRHSMKSSGGSTADPFSDEEADDGSDDDLFNFDKPTTSNMQNSQFRGPEPMKSYGTSGNKYNQRPNQALIRRPGQRPNQTFSQGSRPPLNMGYVGDGERQRYTRDQIRQRNINAFMDGLNESDDEIVEDDEAFEKAKSEDEKHHLLNQIDTLKTILEEDDVDISHIPEVDTESSLPEVQKVHKMLVTKNDSRRCSSMAEEGVLMVAYAMEDVFDGKRVFFGRFRPNLVGWHTTAQNKLRRMRFETSTVVSNALQHYGVGNMGRIGLELVPSMIIYSKRKQSTSHEEDLVDTDEFTDAIRDIQNK